MLKKFYKDNFKYIIGDISYDYTENTHDEFFIKELSNDFNYLEIKMWDNYKDVLSFFILQQMMNGKKILLIIDDINLRSWLFKHILNTYTILKDKYFLNSSYKHYKQYKHNVFKLYSKGHIIFTENIEEQYLPKDFDLIINISNKSQDVNFLLNANVIKKEIKLNKLNIINKYFRTDILGIKLQKLERITKSIINYKNPFTEFYILEQVFKNIKKT